MSPDMEFTRTPEAEACRQALLAAIRPYADRLGKQGMLAVASALVGQMIAIQDHEVVTGEMAIKIVTENIERANRGAVDPLRKIFGGTRAVPPTVHFGGHDERHA